MSLSLVPTIENTKSGAVLTFFLFVCLLWPITEGFGIPDFSATGTLFFLTFMSLVLASVLVSANAVTILQRKIARFRRNDEIWVGTDREILFTYPAFKRYADGPTARFILGCTLVVLATYASIYGYELFAVIFSDQPINYGISWQEGAFGIIIALLGLLIIILAMRDASDERILFAILWFAKAETLSGMGEIKGEFLDRFSEFIQADRWERLQRRMKSDYFDDVYHKLVELESILKEVISTMKKADDEPLPLFPYLFFDDFEQIGINYLTNIDSIGNRTLGKLTVNFLKKFLQLPTSLFYWKDSKFRHQLTDLDHELNKLYRIDLLMYGLGQYYVISEIGNLDNFNQLKNSIDIKNIETKRLAKIGTKNMGPFYLGLFTIGFIEHFAIKRFGQGKTVRLRNIDNELVEFNISFPIEQFETFDQKMERLDNQKRKQFRDLVEIDQIPSFRNNVRYPPDWMTNALEEIYPVKLLHQDLQSKNFDEVLAKLINKRISTVYGIRQLLEELDLRQVKSSAPFVKEEDFSKAQFLKDIPLPPENRW